MIGSARRIESAMALTVAGIRAPLSHCANLRAARIRRDSRFFTMICSATER
jgi:hypothetical protein